MIQQNASWNGSPQMFNILADGSNWHIVMNANNAKCMDLAGGGSTLGNGTRLVINDCVTGKSSEDWTVTTDPQTGAFVSKNVQSGRCMDEPGAPTTSGIALDVWDCLSPKSQKFMVQTFPLN